LNSNGQKLLGKTIQKGTRRRTIKIAKLRGIKHSEQVHSLELGSNGLYVFD